MVQGWQRRAEIAVARRVESKQRKQKKSHRANVKGMVSNLLTQMDKFHCSRVTVQSQRTVLHVWTEPLVAQTLDAVETSLGHEERGSEERRKQEYGSEVGSNSKRRARGLSSDNHDKGSSISSSSISNNSNKKNLCRTHFYKGTCASASVSANSNSKQGNGKKMTGCRHLHPAKHFQTLGDIAGQAQSAALASAEAAFLEASQDGAEEDLGGMEMLNYFPIQLNQEGKHDADGDQQTVGQALTKALRDHCCINASLVYVAFGNVLIFDRYQDGLLVAELGTVFGEGKRISSNSESSQLNTLAGAECLPAAVLEYILTFLPDTSVASMTRVCTSWNSEIGKSSSYLWCQMLERRKWPLPPENPSLLPSARTHEAKCCFQMHYQVVRDVIAVKEALSALVNSKRAAPANDVEMVYQAFSARRTAPSEPNACVAMEVWSPDEVLAAYSHDCTIRLFKAVAKGPTGGKTCRELISVCLNPHRKTSKVKARLVAMALDTDMVGCLLQLQGGSKSAYILSIIQRDAYLEEAGGDTSSLGWSEPEEGVLNVIDINDAIVDFFFANADDLTHHLPTFFDFDGADLADVQVVVSDSLVACGHGKFAVEASIYITNLESDDFDDEAPRIMLCRKLVIISSFRGTVAWMGNLTWENFPSNCHVFLAGCELTGNPGRTTSCRIIAAIPSKSSILHIDVNNTIEGCDGIHSVDAGENVVGEILSLRQRGWQIDNERPRHVVPFPGGSIVAIHVLYKDRENGFRDHRSCVSFFSMGLADEGARHEQHEPLWLFHCNVLHMHRIRDEHVLLVCEELDVNADDSDADPFDEVGGHWFSADPQRHIRGIVVHVPTRQVIDRAHFPFDISEAGTTLSMCCGFNNTIGVGLSWKGVVLTGANVRAVGSCSTQQTRERPGNEADKKKKLARQIYSRKKEGRRAPRCSS